ncbi:MAG: helix-turn-helix transcriptional regulator [Peptococcaceae bacterium]|nr:helix-turn-helix transcriptional regulator [Peptococcaceae bacterium]
MSQLATNLKTFRTNKGLTQAQLAGLVSRDSSLICKIEAGESSGSVATLTKLAAVLEVTVGALLGELGQIQRTCER